MGKGIRHVDWSHTATLVEAIAARHRMTMNNINKNTSAKMRQPERENSFKPPEKSADIPIQTLRARKRATVERQKGPGCDATGALLASKCGPFTGPKNPNGKIGVLFHPLGTGFPLYLKNLHEGVFVKVI